MVRTGFPSSDSRVAQIHNRIKIKIDMKLQDFKNFQPFEAQLKSALHNNYVRFYSNNFKPFAEAVKEWRGSEVTNSEKTCPRCLLKLCKQVAEEYFRYASSPKGKAYLKNGDSNAEEEGENNDADA